jgi:serine/threonine-protein kinase RsbW
MIGAGDEAVILRMGITAADLARLYPWLDSVTAARGVPNAVVSRMHVALEEAVMNVAMHAYAPGEQGEITISLFISSETVLFVVEDTGPPFDPTTAQPRAPASSLKEIEVGGLGLGLLRHYCSDIDYQRTDGRNRLALRFSLT